MKQIILCIILAAGIAAGCNNEKERTSTSKPGYRDTVMKSCNDDTLSRVLCLRDSALQDIHLYDSLSKRYMKDSVPIRAYTIRAVDLLDALGMPAGLADSSICRYKYIRAYLGYRKGNGFKLYLVPVEGACLRNGLAGTDVMLNQLGKAVQTDSKGLEQEQEYVLDLNAPCPRTCPNGLLGGNP